MENYNEKIFSPEEIVDLASNLESSEDPSFVRENLPIFFESLEKSLGIKITSDMNSLYKIMNQENCLVRVESISRIISALEHINSFDVGDGDNHYANAAISEPEGIQLAFSEGQVPGSVRVMIGFGKSLVGFKTDNLEVSNVDFSESEIRDVEKRRYLCRHVEGVVQEEDIRAVIMRIPRNLIKEELLLSEEKNKETRFIFRGFSHTQ